MNSKKNTIFYINLMMIALILIGDFIYMFIGMPTAQHTLCKAITSLLFVLLGGINLIYVLNNGSANKKFSIYILIGLFFAMLGDILLEIQFIVGAIFFGIGHIIFFISYKFIIPFKKTDLLYGLGIIIPAVLLITLAPIFKFEITMKIMCIVYAIVISLMLGKAIANLVSKKTATNVVIFIGSILFFFSDLMLLFDVFGSGEKIFGSLCLLTYYPAEIFLAMSILIAGIFYEKENPVTLEEKNVRAESNFVGTKKESKDSVIVDNVEKKNSDDNSKTVETKPVKKETKRQSNKVSKKQ